VQTLETEYRTRSPRKLSWDVIRVLAVYSVVVQHITHQSPINHPELGPYPFVLPLGASTLLVVSAFFVCVTVRRGETGRWLRHRLARLLPAYLLAVVITYEVTHAVSPMFGWYVPDDTDLWSNLLLVQAWSPQFHWIDASYWTLPVQVMAFVAAAVLWPRRWAHGRAVVVLLWTLVLAPLVIRFAWRHDDAAQWVKSVFDGLALHRVALFGAGIAIWLWTRDRLSGKHLGAYLVVVLIAQDAHSYFVDTWSTVGFGVILIGVVAAAGGPDWDVPGLRRLARPIRWLGGISFGVYLVHQELGFVLARFLLDAGVGPWGRLAACVAMAIVLGWAMTRLVEQPVHRWLTSDVWRRARVTASAVVEAIRDLPVVPQPQAPRSGGVPSSADEPGRPVSQASTADAGPRSTVSASVPTARSHSR
jgi:peptidoglycan/LPS O-acetylase OafA/YrhL